MEIQRRSLLAGVPALAFASLPAVAAQDDPLLALEREAVRLRAWLKTLPCPADDDGADRRYAALDAVEEAIIRTPATTFAGIAVKLRFYAEMEGHSADAEYQGIDRRAFLSALADAERLAS